MQLLKKQRLMNFGKNKNTKGKEMIEGKLINLDQKYLFFHLV
jgi:hypothetical protein